MISQAKPTDRLIALDSGFANFAQYYFVPYFARTFQGDHVRKTARPVSINNGTSQGSFG